MRVKCHPTPQIEVHSTEMGGRAGAETMLEKIRGGADRKARHPSRDELTDRPSIRVRCHARVLDYRPCDARRTQPDRAPVLGERIEVRVAGRVGALPGHAKERRHRGVQHKKLERLPSQELVQVPRAVDLRGERGRELVGIDRRDHRRRHDACRMDHAAYPMPTQHLGERVAIGHVATLHDHVRAPST